MIQTVSGQTPGVPPGAKTVRVPGSQEAVAPLHYDPVGPWGESRSPTGIFWEPSIPCNRLPYLAEATPDAQEAQERGTSFCERWALASHPCCHGCRRHTRAGEGPVSL